MSASTRSASPDVAEEDDDGADLPLTMAASVVLEHLPKDAHKALETAGELEQAKGTLDLTFWLCVPTLTQLQSP
jgi:ubiquitin-like protein ATG12